MKICFLSADRGISLEKHNGAAAQVRSLVHAFLNLGHEVLFVTPSRGGEDLKAPIFRIEAPQILESLMADISNGKNRKEKRMTHALGHIWNNVLVEQALRDIYSRKPPDLLFEVYSPYGVAAGILAKQLHTRHILNVHAPLAWEGMEYREQALQEAADALEQIAFHSAQKIVTNSKELQQQLMDAGVPSEKITSVPNGVDVEMFAPVGETSFERIEGKIVIGFVGSLKAWHGIDILADAFRILAADPRFHLLVIGDGPMAKMLQKLSAEYPGRITLTAAVPLERVPSFVRAMDIAVAPYPPLERFYFSPLKVLEYMAAGKAVVASNIGQITEMISDGKTGVLVPPGDVASLVNAVRQLAEDEPLRKQIGIQAAAEAVANHTWKRRAREIIQLAEGLHLQ